MRIAILGTRGVPARYGGFETFAEELGRRLVARGHEVTVYCRERYVPLDAAQGGVRVGSSEGPSGGGLGSTGTAGSGSEGKSGGELGSTGAAGGGSEGKSGGELGSTGAAGSGSGGKSGGELGSTGAAGGGSGGKSGGEWGTAGAAGGGSGGKSGGELGSTGATGSGSEGEPSGRLGSTGAAGSGSEGKPGGESGTTVGRGNVSEGLGRGGGGEDGATYRGMRLVYLPSIRHKYLETLAHTAVSMLHAVTQGFDVILCCNAANAIFCWLPRVFGTPVALNVDGLERNRKKWNRFAKAWYLMSERLSTFCPTHAVSDAEAIRDYYRERYGCKTTFISYGAEQGKLESAAALGELGLERERYFLYVSRWEPENNALLVRESFERVETSMRLALIGDAPYAPEYIARVRDTRDKRIVMPGYVFGQGYKELGSHCFAYIHATEVGGTHPALIEAMGRGALVLYLDTTENREVAGGCGLAFTHTTLADVMRLALELPNVERAAYQAAATARVQERYSWDAITTEYEKLFGRLT